MFLFPGRPYSPQSNGFFLHCVKYNLNYFYFGGEEGVCFCLMFVDVKLGLTKLINQWLCCCWRWGSWLVFWFLIFLSLLFLSTHSEITLCSWYWIFIDLYYLTAAVFHCMVVYCYLLNKNAVVYLWSQNHNKILIAIIFVEVIQQKFQFTHPLSLSLSLSL